MLWEPVNQQMEKYEEGSKPNSSTGYVNKIFSKSVQSKSHEKKACTRCGSFKHDSQDPKCPAKESVCTKCNFIGHYRKCCKSKRKRKLPQDFPSNNPSKFSKTKQTQNDIEQVDYIFHIDDDITVSCEISGVTI